MKRFKSNLPAMFHDNWLPLIFDNFFENWNTPLNISQINYPMNIYTDNGGLHLEVAATGVEKKDVNIRIKNSVLSIDYENKHLDPNNGEREYYIQKVCSRSFNYSYNLNPQVYDIDSIKADQNNGLIHVFIPYLVKEKEIDIEKKIMIE